MAQQGVGVEGDRENGEWRGVCGCLAVTVIDGSDAGCDAV